MGQDVRQALEFWWVVRAAAGEEELHGGHVPAGQVDVRGAQSGVERGGVGRRQAAVLRLR